LARLGGIDFKPLSEERPSLYRSYSGGNKTIAGIGLKITRTPPYYLKNRPIMGDFLNL